MKITLIGTAYPYRGGLALYNERLMEEFLTMKRSQHKYFFVTISIFSIPCKTQYATWDKPEKFPIKRSVNSINPFNWIKVGFKIKKERPDIVLIKYWLLFLFFYYFKDNKVK